jgi:hypothetical protein
VHDVVQKVPPEATRADKNRRGNRHRGGAAAVHESPEEENPTKLLVWPGERVCKARRPVGAHPHPALKAELRLPATAHSNKPPPKPIHKTGSLLPTLPPKNPSFTNKHA